MPPATRCRRSALLLAALPALLATSCTTWSMQYFVDSDDDELARVVRPDGSIETFVLHVNHASGDASLQVITEYDRDRPFLGLKTRELDEQQAERRGAPPFTGLLVTGCYPRSAAERGGVLAGDVLLAIDGEELVRQRQLPRLEARLAVGQSVLARVLRGRDELELSLSVQSLRERITDRQEVPLDAPNPQRSYAGVHLRGVPAVWAERMGVPAASNLVVVTRVEIGSPAWLSGFRGGDRIEAVDDGPVPTVFELSDRIAQRGPDRLPIVLRVVRHGIDRHQASVPLRDYSRSKEVWLPLVFHVEDGVAEDAWSVGPFGLLLNSHSRYVGDNRKRTAETSSVFNALFGLIHVKSAPDDSCLRLLWLFHLHT